MPLCNQNNSGAAGPRKKHNPAGPPAVGQVNAVVFKQAIRVGDATCICNVNKNAGTKIMHVGLINVMDYEEQEKQE